MPKEKKEHGGNTIYVKQGISYEEVSHVEDIFQGIKLMMGKNVTFVANVYRRYGIEAEVDGLVRKFMENARTQYDNPAIVISGDYN